MANLHDALVYSLAATQGMVDWFIADFSNADWLHRTDPKSNCAAWIIGHLILVDRRVLGRMGVSDLAPLPDGFEKRFGQKDDAPAAREFGDVTILRPLFAATRGQLIEAAKKAPADVLEKPVDPPHPRFQTVWQMIQFMGIHSAVHAGQISAIRRSLGRPPLI